MKLVCENGFYKFFPEWVGELKLLKARTDIELFAREDYFTFAPLVNFPNYSLTGQLLHGVNVAIANYAGRPEEVMDKNKLTYNIKLGIITPRALVNIQQLDYSNGAFVTFPKLPQAYALDGLRVVKGFNAFIDVKMKTFKLERFEYENI